MSKSACTHCANEIPQGARVCANCGVSVSEAALPQAEEAPPREVPADTQKSAPSPPVERPISFGLPTREAQQNRVRRGRPTYPTLRGSAKKSRPGWLPSWFALPVAVIAGLIVTLGLFFVPGTVKAGVLDSLGLTKTLQGGESNEAQTTPEDVPTATRSNAPTATPSPSPAPSPSDFLSAFLPSYLSFSPSVSGSLSPSTSR